MQLIQNSVFSLIFLQYKFKFRASHVIRQWAARNSFNKRINIFAFNGYLCIWNPVFSVPTSCADHYLSWRSFDSYSVNALSTLFGFRRIGSALPPKPSKFRSVATLFPFSILALYHQPSPIILQLSINGTGTIQDLLLGLPILFLE